MNKLILLVVSASAVTLSNPAWPICNGTNGPNCRKDEGLVQGLPICNGTNGPNCRKDEDLLAQKKLPTCEP